MKKVDFYGVFVTDEHLPSFVSSIIRAKKHGESVNIMSINLTALRDLNREMWHYMQNFSHVTADGNGVKKISSILPKKIKHQIAISTLAAELLKRADIEKMSVFLLGAKERENNLARHFVEQNFTGIRVDGHHGYFDEFNMDEIIGKIKNFSPDIVLVGISSPKKERCIVKIAERYSGSINIACGGFIDILAGKTSRAPKLIQHLSLEWIYRFFQEPKRMFRPMIVNGLYFLIIIFPKLIIESYVKKNNRSLLEIIKN